MTQLNDFLLERAIEEHVEQHRKIQEEIVRRFPIGSKVRGKLSGDVLTIWSTSANVGCMFAVDKEHNKRELHWTNMERINDAPAES